MLMNVRGHESVAPCPYCPDRDRHLISLLLALRALNSHTSSQLPLRVAVSHLRCYRAVAWVSFWIWVMVSETALCRYKGVYQPFKSTGHFLVISSARMKFIRALDMMRPEEQPFCLIIIAAMSVIVASFCMWYLTLVEIW
jgi:hypothetical protein